MLLAKGTRKSKTLAHWAAVALGMILGIYLFGAGIPAMFSIVGDHVLRDVISCAITCFTLLPISVLAIFKPRLAAYGVLVWWIGVLTSGLVSSIQRPSVGDLSASDYVSFSVFWVILPSMIAGLLLYASGCDETAMASTDGRHKEA